MKLRNSLITITLVTLFTLVSLPLTSTAHAQTVGLSITPPVIEILIKPSTSVIHAFTIQNQGETTTIVPKIHTIKPSDSFGHSTFDSTTTLLDSPLTISLENANYELNQPLTISAGETIQLVLKITSQPVEEPVDAYLALVLDSSSTGFANTQLTANLSALMLTTITETTSLPVDLEISSLPSPLILDSLSPLTIAPIATNNSPHMIRPLGKMVITNWRGHIVHDQELYPHLILRESTRTLQAIQYDPGNESNTSSTPLSWQPSSLDYGPHQITVTLTSQSDELFSEISKTIWIFPFQMGIYLLVAIILSITVWVYKRSANQKPSS